MIKTFIIHEIFEACIESLFNGLSKNLNIQPKEINTDPCIQIIIEHLKSGADVFIEQNKWMLVENDLLNLGIDVIVDEELQEYEGELYAVFSLYEDEE